MEDFQGYIILFLSFLIPLTIIRAILVKSCANRHLPPSPFALPIIGHIYLLSPLVHQCLHKLSSSLGPLIHLYFGSILVVVASSPEMAKEILKTQETSFLNRPHLFAIDRISYRSGTFGFANFGPYWKFMRKICTVHLLGGQTLLKLSPIRSEELKRFLNSLLKKVDAKEGLDVGGELGKFMSNVISRMAFGRRCCDGDDEAEAIRTFVKEATEVTGRYNLSDSFRFLEKLDLQGIGKICQRIHEKYDALLEKIISDHEEARATRKYNGNGEDVVKDLLHILLDISEDENSEIRMTKDHIKGFILDMVVAGIDTSSNTIAWALAELINHPQIMNKAREEIDNIIGKTRLVEESDIPNLPYIEAITKETLRLHPASPLVARAWSKSCTINGYYIPENAWVYVNVWSIGRNPTYWEDPLEFKPERFLNEQGRGKSLMDVRGQNFQFLPFGSGRRICPGTTLAVQVVQVSIAAMIQCFEWKLVNEMDGMVNMDEGPGAILHRANPLICVPVPRFSPLPI